MIAAPEEPAAEPVVPEPHWLLGDLHVHVSPPDPPGHAALTVESALAAARLAGLDFVILTPHGGREWVPEEGGPNAVTGQVFVRRRIAALAKASSKSKSVPGKSTTVPPPRPLLAISGWEFTRTRPGHLGISFADASPVGLVPDDRVARTALDAGGLVVVNHPFLRPVASDQPLMRGLKAVRSWEPFRHPEQLKTDTGWNAIEVWHDRCAWIQMLHRGREEKFPDTQMIRLALKAWDRATAVQKRRITAVGGSDAHGRFPYTMAPMPMVSVLLTERTKKGLSTALRAAHVTFGRGGGVAARTFHATSDVKGQKAAIGDALKANEMVTLTWTGKARLFENGKDVGAFDGGTKRKLPTKNAFAFWRIECADHAYSNMIYANLPH